MIKKDPNEVIMDAPGTVVPKDADVVENDMFTSIGAEFRQKKFSLYEAIKK